MKCYYNLIIFRFTRMTYIQSQVFNILLESCYYKSEKTIGRIALVERTTPKWIVLECQKKINDCNKISFIMSEKQVDENTTFDVDLTNVK